MSSLNRRLLAASCFALLISACSSSPGSAKADSVKPAKDRKQAPEFALKDINGRTVRLSEFRGKVVLLNFWATWCGPCKIEIPWFKEFEQQHKDAGFAVIGLSMDEEGWEVVKPYVEAEQINYRVLLGSDQIAELYGGVNSLPTTFLIDREGRVASVHVGLVSKSTYQNDIKQILGGPAGHSGPVAGLHVPAWIVRAD